MATSGKACCSETIRRAPLPSVKRVADGVAVALVAQARTPMPDVTRDHVVTLGDADAPEMLEQMAAEVFDRGRLKKEDGRCVSRKL